MDQGVHCFNIVKQARQQDLVTGELSTLNRNRYTATNLIPTAHLVGLGHVEQRRRKST